MGPKLKIWIRTEN